MARTNIFKNKTKLVKALQGVEHGEVSRFLSLQLVEKGLVKIEQVHTDKRGRPAHKFELTGKARGYLALSKNWGKISNLQKNEPGRELMVIELDACGNPFTH